MTLEQLYAQIGGAYSDTLGRLRSEKLIERFIRKFPDDPSFSQLETAIAEKDWETAFRAAHTLKGVAQNLGLQELYLVDEQLTEALRGPKELQDKELFQKVSQCYQKTVAGIREFAGE